MRASRSIVPGIDRDAYLVLDDFGLGCAWRETNVEDTDLEAVINDLLEGQYKNPVRVISFNLSEGWVRDVSEEIARKLREHCADEDRELPDSLHQLVEQAARN
jgi:DNA replication protein DnaC